MYWLIVAIVMGNFIYNKSGLLIVGIGYQLENLLEILLGYPSIIVAITSAAIVIYFGEWIKNAIPINLMVFYYYHMLFSLYWNSMLCERLDGRTGILLRKETQGDFTCCNHLKAGVAYNYSALNSISDILYFKIFFFNISAKIFNIIPELSFSPESTVCFCTGSPFPNESEYDQSLNQTMSDFHYINWLYIPVR